MFPTPKEVKQQIELSPEERMFVDKSKEEIINILNQNEKKILIIGPCSIHNHKEAIEYANKVKELQEKVKEEYFLVMRTYFEKPRTVVGWKGMFHDPFLNETDDIEKGILTIRKLLKEIISLGVPTATEFLGTINHTYINDMICYASIGARNTESQPHREIVSGMDIPVGFKNATSGDYVCATNSISSSNKPHSYLGINPEGKVDIIKTEGNKNLQVILRGGVQPNYDLATIQKVEKELERHNLKKIIIVDCSHGNSQKDHNNQRMVFETVISYNNPSVKGLMLESNLEEGNQKYSDEMKCGVSITDACISWKETEEIIMNSILSQKNEQE